MFQNCIHGLAHTSHHAKLGEGYWGPYRNHVINNQGDGENGNFSGLGNNPGHVALGEAWAEYIQDRYSGFGGGENNPWRSNYIPMGLMFDLQDYSQDDPFIILGVDNKYRWFRCRSVL